MSAKRMVVAVNRCPNHPEYWAVSVDEEHAGGTRITPGKCCGRWQVVREWQLDAGQLREAARVFEDAAADAEEGE